ncbi:MAG: phage tail sheath subtilisin-like domain-containing protein [Bacteroidetes bacterium]|nr:phage tail sheath subtilisin-like domain-containing protein [Bacteroidota bacterium]
MSLNISTPGVYINEINAFPNSVVQVPTALPVFIGYTKRNVYNGKSLKNQVIEIQSMTDFIALFGEASNAVYALNKEGEASDVQLNNIDYSLNVNTNTQFYLYNSIQLFYQNGGGTCYVMSVGTFAVEGVNGVRLSDFVNDQENVFSVLLTNPEPTMILIPDALLLSQQDYYSLMNKSIDHCGIVQSRIALLDVYGGSGKSIDVTAEFRTNISSPSLSYGAAYYPWVNTTIVEINQITFLNIEGGFSGALVDTDPSIAARVSVALAGLPQSGDYLSMSPQDQQKVTMAHNSLLLISPNYNNLISTIVHKINCLPITPAIAGLINTVDNAEGVFKAPANVGISAVVSPVVNINDATQGDLNVPLDGKAINAIRSFAGRGILVWGARTLDGNSNDYRYINVRRTLIMIEQSIKAAMQAYVFEANDTNTWATVKSMIENFLTNLWKEGALAGAQPADAFNVSVGLGSTMTGQDILNGYMNVSVMVAITHPAEFIELAFQQQMQTS